MKKLYMIKYKYDRNLTRNSLDDIFLKEVK